MNLRDYQNSAINTVLTSFESGEQRQLLELATGTGKTVIFSELIKQLTTRTGKKALVVAHRDLLLTQARDKLSAIAPMLRIGIEQDTHHAPFNSDVIIASVDTIKNSNRIGKFSPEDFCIVVVDEAHRSSASTYKTIFRHFGVLKSYRCARDYLNPKELGIATKFFPEDRFILRCDNKNNWNDKTLLLGVTATPERSDDLDIEDIFGKSVFKFGIIDAIKGGWLVPIHGYTIWTSTDLRKIKRREGDFDLDELSVSVNNPLRNKTIVDTYEKFCKGESTLVFGANVIHSMALLNEFRLRGIHAEIVLGTTPQNERERILADFHQRKFPVMINNMVLTEGWDEPVIKNILLARPTQSNILYNQMIGRGTRPMLTDNGSFLLEKSHVCVFDFVDKTNNVAKSLASLLGKPNVVNFTGQAVIS
jgi:ATP-dependent helicase IRC3